jgi:replication-associated recombination protein RarA
LAEISLKKFNEEENYTVRNCRQRSIKYSGGDARKLINSIELVLINSKIQEKRNYQRRCAFGFARNNGTL